MASVLIDLDHFVDMAYYRISGHRDHQIVPLHSWELVGIGLLSRRKTVRAMSAGALAHLLTDWLVGDYEFRQLSLGYRVVKRFRTGWIGDWADWPFGDRGWRGLFYSDSEPD